jgi:hypothetical protein
VTCSARCLIPRRMVERGRKVRPQGPGRIYHAKYVVALRVHSPLLTDRPELKRVANHEISGFDVIPSHIVPGSHFGKVCVFVFRYTTKGGDLLVICPLFKDVLICRDTVYTFLKLLIGRACFPRDREWAMLIVKSLYSFTNPPPTFTLLTITKCALISIAGRFDLLITLIIYDPGRESAGVCNGRRDCKRGLIRLMSTRKHPEDKTLITIGAITYLATFIPM